MTVIKEINSGLPKEIRSVAVIGAGPVGAGLTKALVNEKSFDKIKVFEKRSTLGGLWNYTKPHFKSHSENISASIPCEEPHGKRLQQLKDKNGVIFQSAVYKYLDTNVPKDLMEYKDLPFPEGSPLFPLREQVYNYIVSCSKEIENLVSFNSEVTKVHYDDDKHIFSILTKDLNTGNINTENFDAVAIATGFYDLPFVPNRPGLKEWHSQFPHSVSHAKDFDAPEDFKDIEGKIVVVGNSASGSDLAFELAGFLNKVVYKSRRSESFMPSGSHPLIEDVADILRFDPKTKSLLLVNGERLENVEKVIFCTGYLKYLPFLPSESEVKSHGDKVLQSLVTDGARLHNLYNHIIPYNLPSFGIIGLPKYVLPTRLSETQGAWLARLWSKRIQLPTMEIMKYYDQWFQETNGTGGKYHDMLFPMDVQYSQRLNKEIREAGNGGYFGVEWSSEEIKLRSSIKVIKESYLSYFRDTGKRAENVEELLHHNYFRWPKDAKLSVEPSEVVP
ncbi:LADA_0G00254g1_1 [Lachancea dasiensis]|uniref:LADA_0G00254g1_1 n=1 Tax=Lachancea dasiensis TaxID=1072105 RepID=A0A1G4JQ34_9SACH|nr:LADA_0G00254g1_1 [Lachancea dasiensis]